jgi:acyl carrier protein
MNEALTEIIYTVLENKGAEKPAAILPEMHLRKDIGLDSLDLAELTVRIEAAFDVDVFEDGVVNTVGEILQKISR